MTKPKYLEDAKPTSAAACHWLPGQKFRVMKIDPADLHSAWYVVTPDGCMLTFNDCADDALDEARANWVASALNAALSPVPVARALICERCGVDRFKVGCPETNCAFVIDAAAP